MLSAIIGNMGVGKTATMAWLASHFSEMKYNIFSNFNLKTINYKHVLTTQDIDSVQHGKAFYDEFWLWLDSRCSSFDEMNKRISDILLKSRKRDYDITYSLQGFYQIDKRIRNVTDYILMPQSYWYNEGKLKTIDQSYLYPIDLSPFLDEMVICVDICKPAGEYELEKVDDFSFWLRDVVNCYDTTEEITDIKTPLEKGCYVENKFMNYLKVNIHDAIITQSPNSGHYLNSLDVEIMYKDKNHLIDVTSVTERKTKGYDYFYIDRRDKKLSRAFEISELRKSRIWTAYFFLNEYHFVDMKNPIFGKLCENKDLINLRDLSNIALNLEEFKNELER